MPSQGSLFFADPPVRRTREPKKATDYDFRNLETAKIVLEEIRKHGGPDAGIVVWAMAVIHRLEPSMVTVYERALKGLRERELQQA